MSLLWYKLTLAPLMVVAATLAGRRWGAAAAGLVAGLPIVAGPILWFYAVEQGPAYAQAAAISTLLGLVSLGLFAVAYGWRAWSGGGALSSLLLSWVAFAVGTTLINGLLAGHDVGLGRAFFYGLAALFLALRSLPPAEAGAAAPSPPPSFDLPLRLVATAGLVWGLTHYAQALGPRLGGLLTPFPVASTVLTVFAHRQGGSDAARSVLKGLLLALNAFAVFCLALALCLPRAGIAVAFGVALAASALVQAAVVTWQVQHRARG